MMKRILSAVFWAIVAVFAAEYANSVTFKIDVDEKVFS